MAVQVNSARCARLASPCKETGCAACANMRWLGLRRSCLDLDLDTRSGAAEA